MSAKPSSDTTGRLNWTAIASTVATARLSRQAYTATGGSLGQTDRYERFRGRADVPLNAVPLGLAVTDEQETGGHAPALKLSRVA